MIHPRTRDINWNVRRLVDGHRRPTKLLVRGSARLDFAHADQEIGAPSTRSWSGRALSGHNTDAGGFIKPLERGLAIWPQTRLAILVEREARRARGVGSLRQVGARVTLFCARWKAKASVLAEKFTRVATARRCFLRQTLTWW